MRILITCPPMIRSLSEVEYLFKAHGAECFCPPIRQVLTETELIALVPEFEGWIIGDDPATRPVFEAGMRGRLRAAVKFGVGVDNVDLASASQLGLPIANTPQMFGNEVADMAMGYVIALARETFGVSQQVREGEWPKPVGISLSGKNVALVGFGDIGQQIARRLLACEMNVIAYDPLFKRVPGLEAVANARWPEQLPDADFLVLACSLTQANRHLIDGAALARCKKGIRIVNVSRGPLIDEGELAEFLSTGHVHSAALEVFEHEPLPLNSRLRLFPRCIFGSHNASNTHEAVTRAGTKALLQLFQFLGQSTK